MSKKWKLVVGFAAGVGAAYLVYKINKEINEMPSETGEYKEKAANWLNMKKESIKDSVDKRRAQIKELTEKAKQALLSEESAEKRKEIMEKTAEKIAVLKEEIKVIISKGAKEIGTFASKVSNSEMFGNIAEFFSSLKQGDDGEILEVDYSFESDFDEE